MTLLKKIILGLLLLIVLAAIVAFVKFNGDKNNPYQNEISEDLIPHFKKVKLDFVHNFNSTESLPVTASVLIDLDNDGIDELFLGGGFNQQDQMFTFKNGQFEKIDVGLGTKNNLSSLAGASVDIDKNGFTDLLISRENGITIYYNNGGKLSPQKLDYPLKDDATPLGLSLGDIDKDGHIDIFVSNYIRKKQMVGQNNFTKDYGPVSQLLMNNGDNTFRDVTAKAGLSFRHNTFMGIMIDIDNDSWLDLIVVHDTGEIRTYRNMGNGEFEMMSNPSTNKFAYPMGIAVGDYNNDGLVDFMFSNTGTTVPTFMASGNIKDKSLFNSHWIFFENKGNFQFEDVSEKTQTKDFEFSWGAVFADMNNDGLQELIVAENYISFPPHSIFKLPGRFLTQKKDHTFVATEEKSGITNPYFGITPLVSDFNQDGYLDMVWANIGSPVFAFLNEGGSNNYLQVKMNDNVESIGAKLKVTTSSGREITEDFIIGEGLVSDQTATIHFGIGQDKIKNIEVKFINGDTFEVNNPQINSTLIIPNKVMRDSLALVNNLESQE